MFLLRGCYIGVTSEDRHTVIWTFFHIRSLKLNHYITEKGFIMYLYLLVIFGQGWRIYEEMSTLAKYTHQFERYLGMLSPISKWPVLTEPVKFFENLVAIHRIPTFSLLLFHSSPCIHLPFCLAALPISHLLAGSPDSHRHQPQMWIRRSC